MGYINPNTWFLYTHAGTMPPPQPRQTDYQGQFGIREGAITARLPHTLQTADVVPCFTPSWTTNVWPIAITSSYVDAAFAVPAPNKSSTMDFSVSRGTSVAVSAGATTAAVSHNAGSATAVWLYAANWNTTLKIVSKDTGTTNLSFSLEAPANAVIYYASHADESDFTSTEVISSGAVTHTITHSASRAFLPIFMVPYWNTNITWQDKSGLNETIVKFSVPAPATTALDTRVKLVGNIVVS